MGVDVDVPGDFEFSREDDGSLSIESAVFQALGAASMCWGETPRGVFDSERASSIGHALIAELALHDAAAVDG